ncbi:hypothetical protein CPC08DRAFT_726926 [Agrocybe pediades]|nr:hypothetical protein CPC08DRAFT_726926 [Agrocybe pediades]
MFGIGERSSKVSEDGTERRGHHVVIDVGGAHRGRDHESAIKRSTARTGGVATKRRMNPSNPSKKRARCIENKEMKRREKTKSKKKSRDRINTPESGARPLEQQSVQRVEARSKKTNKARERAQASMKTKRPSGHQKPLRRSIRQVPKEQGRRNCRPPAGHERATTTAQKGFRERKAQLRASEDKMKEGRWKGKKTNSQTKRVDDDEKNRKCIFKNAEERVEPLDARAQPLITSCGQTRPAREDGSSQGEEEEGGVVVKQGQRKVDAVQSYFYDSPSNPYALAHARFWNDVSLATIPFMSIIASSDMSQVNADASV